jgi:hypothetical protein
MANVLLDFEELPCCGNSLRVSCEFCVAKLHADCVHPEGVPLRKGLEGRGAVTARSAVTEPPESPVFCGAKNAPK